MVEGRGDYSLCRNMSELNDNPLEDTTNKLGNTRRPARRSAEASVAVRV